MALDLPLAHPKIDSNNMELLYPTAADCFHKRGTARESWIDATAVEFGLVNGIAGSFLRPDGATIQGFGLSRVGQATFDTGNLSGRRLFVSSFARKN